MKYIFNLLHTYSNLIEENKNKKLSMSCKENLKTNNQQISSNLQNYVCKYKSQFVDLDNQPYDVECLLCNFTYILPTNEQDFLSHLFNAHRLVIGDVEKIASLKSYIRYWRMKFKEQPLTAFCTTLTSDKDNSNSSSADSESNKKEFYFLLSDCIMEDRTLRDELHRAKLEWVLAEQVKERADTTFKRGCMFCRMEFSGSRMEYLNHLYQKHNILLGKPDSLVFIDEYLDKIERNIESFICIYCEKNFKNRVVLKEHMRKKLHKQVNPNNKAYDKYYIRNYLPETSKNEKRKSYKMHNIEAEEEPSGFSDNEDEDWSDWNNETTSETISCLFCSHSEQEFSPVLEHMKSKHGFDFENISKDLTFYQKVKIVNYIRKQIHTNRCVYCDENIDDVNAHMDEQKHYKLPEKQIWDQLEFYFPMFESDSFLYSLDDSDGDEVTS